MMDEKSLVKQRELLRINNYRDNNRLKYSGKNKGDTPNPLPKGPRRNEILKNIDSRLKEMAKLDLLIQKLRNKNADSSR